MAKRRRQCLDIRRERDSLLSLLDPRPKPRVHEWEAPCLTNRCRVGHVDAEEQKESGPVAVWQTRRVPGPPDPLLCRWGGNYKYSFANCGKGITICRRT